jgi:hypothetical protein
MLGFYPYGQGDAAQQLIQQFALPDTWEARYWDDPSVKFLMEMDPKAVAALVPTQSGLKWCRCPACGAGELDDPMTWTPETPEKITCRKCQTVFPNDTIPAKVPPAPGLPPAIPEEVVEVVPRVLHRYPYHPVEPERQQTPDERIYLAAKRDALARAFLSKFALYAAVRHHEQSTTVPDPRLGRLAATILLRFAQVYPRFAAHLDTPGRAKVLHPANLKPPFRPGYLTARWESRACHEVPLDLAIAYALLNGSPYLNEAATLLGVAEPQALIEQDLLRASATFLQMQPHEASEAGLIACRGMLLAGRLLGDIELLTQATIQLDQIAEHAFHHDGTWRTGGPLTHRRVVGLIDGWIRPLLEHGPPPASSGVGQGPDGSRLPGSAILAMAKLARNAVHHAVTDRQRDQSVQMAAFDNTPLPYQDDVSHLHGGLGVAHLTAHSRSSPSLTIEMANTGSDHPECQQRLGFTLALGGRRLLGRPPSSADSPRGWDRASASGNLVLVNGLNQRESLAQLHRHTPPSDVRFFAAVPELQVACLEDRSAYPTTTSLYRHTFVTVAGVHGTYGVSLFEVQGGTQHDQVLHAAPELGAQWQPLLTLVPGPRSLLPPSVEFLSASHVEDGRWFVQALGELDNLRSARVDGPVQAVLSDGQGPGVRLHILGDRPATLIVGEPREAPAGQASSALLLRRRSTGGAPLATRFITLFEPVLPGRSPSLRRVGRVESSSDCVAIAIETDQGPEFLVINTRPQASQAVPLGERGVLRTDALAVHITNHQLIQAGGTYAEFRQRRSTAPPQWGSLTSAARAPSATARGWFETATSVDSPERAAGRTLVVRHGDGSSHAWTIDKITSPAVDRSRIDVVEEPGFTIDPATGDAIYYQHPRTRVPGPHLFRVCHITRSTPERAAVIDNAVAR